MPPIMFGKKDHCHVCFCFRTSRNDAGNTGEDVGGCGTSDMSLRSLFPRGKEYRGGWSSSPGSARAVSPLGSAGFCLVFSATSFHSELAR